MAEMKNMMFQYGIGTHGRPGGPNGVGDYRLGWVELGGDNPPDLLSLGTRGKYGFPNGIGETWLGWSQIGDENYRSGYYQKHWNRFAYCWSKSKFYWNPPHITEKALTWKGVFRSGVTAWHALTDSERLAYNEMRYPIPRSGFNRFMTKYLKEHR